MAAPLGAEVGLYYDTDRVVRDGHYIQTSTGRTYLVTDVRVQERGEHAGRRKHVRAIVVPKSAIEPGEAVHILHWYKRR